MKTLPILIVEDDCDLREALCDTLGLAGYESMSAADGPAALAILAKKKVGLVVTDVQMHPMDGHTLLREIKTAHPYVPVMLMTAYGMIDKAVEAMRDGACTYLTKPFEPDKLLVEVARYMLSTQPAAGSEVIAEDPRMKEILALACKVAATTATVMITGESGCGKEVMAHFVHRNSPRAGKPFVAINCAAIPENLLESTLFGYEKGAFTGAAQSHAGKFEQAQGGTLLLDEISEMSLPLQAKLLRVLQEREVERVGGHKTISLDIRIIATSNRDMRDLVKRGDFREDLYYRLNVFPVELPPLRERSLDIVPLARHLMQQLGIMLGRTEIQLSAGAVAQLTRYPWPGNIRELENVLQRALILSTGNLLEADVLLLPETATSAAPQEKIAAAGAAMDMKSLEKAHILEMLASVGGSRKLTAEKLGMSERTLRYKLQQYREESGEIEH